MFDDIEGSVGVFDFDELANHLLEQGLDASPSTLHGCLSGLLAAGAAMEDEEFDFHPLLPDDEVEIAVRTDELANWCKGFLAGFAQVNQSQVGQDSSEILRDLAAIAEASVDEDVEEDESEGSYIEIVEYVRFATLNIYMESRSGEGEKSDRSLH